MKISLITLERCPPCARAKSLLAHHEIPFENVVAGETPESRTRFYELLAKTGHRVAPQLFIDDIFIAKGGDVPRYIQGHVEFLKAAS